jgi:hypothetical protein
VAGGGGSDGGASAGQPAGGAAGAPTGPVQAVLGRRCTVASTIGVVQLAGFPAPYVQATLFDRPDPWVGEPELVTDTCAYHHYEAGACEACAPGETCSSTSECVPEPRSVKDATLVVSTASERREYRANAELGGLYSPIDIGDESSEYSMTLRWGETTITLPPMAVASGELVGLRVSIEGDSQAPGALDVTWAPSGQGGFVRSRIPINHHAAGPTFTDCAAPENAGSLHADADMVDPLAVKTGLEFQGVEHSFIAAAETDAGCVEFRFGTPILAFPD